MSNPELNRIRADLAKARQRLAEMQTRAPATDAGALAVSTKLGIPNGTAAWASQIKARETDIARLESELVYAMVPVWGAAAILEKMEAPTLAAQVIERPPSDADVTAKLAEILSHIPDKTPIGEVKRSLLQ
jgi:hypothetical protein